MQTKLLINGQLVQGEGPAQAVFNPALGRVLVEINEASEAQVDAAVRAADAAFENWSQTAPKDRSLLLLKFAGAIEAHRGERRRILARPYLDDPPRSGRRDRVHRAVELPADDGRVENRPGPGRR